MDIYKSRTAGVGFVFMVVFFMYWAAVDSEGLVSLADDIVGSASEGLFTFIVAILGGAISLPIVGLSTEYVARFFADVLRGRSDSFPNMELVGTKARNLAGLPSSVSGRGVYHLIFYSNCDAKIREWSHRRRNRMYASIANCFAAGCAFLFAWWIFSMFSGVMLLAVALFFIVNLRTFYSELRYHDEMVEAWWESYLSGPKSSLPPRSISVSLSDGSKVE